MKLFNEKNGMGKGKVPETVDELLDIDTCGKLLDEFAENELQSCHLLVLVWQDSQGEVFLHQSGNCDDVVATGLLSIAEKLAFENN